MTAKEYLSQLREVKRQQEIMKDEINELTVKAGYGTGKQFDGLPARPTQHSRMEAVVLRKIDLIAEWEESLARLDELEYAIMQAINAVEDKVYQSILLLRYVRCCKWEQIAIAMNYSLDNVYKLHGKALAKVRVPQS